MTEKNMKAISWIFAVVVLAVLAIAKAHAAASAAAPVEVALGDIVSVPIGVACPSYATVQKYKLLVNGSYMGIAAQGCVNDVDAAKDKPTSHIQFLLRKDSDPPASETAVAWRTLIGRPGAKNDTPMTRMINFGVSDENGKDISAANPGMTFIWSPEWKSWAGGIVFVIVLLLFVLLGAFTSLVRDVGRAVSVPFKQRTFSLARTQMAWWTLIVVGSYIYEWIASGTMPPLSAQALALMGIYSVLTVSSRSVDLNRQTKFPPSSPGVFFNDLVSDESGVAIHRVQMLVFTIIVGLMFIYQVVTTTSMPALEPYTLTMIGISGATYIGLKATEPQPKQEENADNAAGAAAPGPIADGGIKAGYSEGEADGGAGSAGNAASKGAQANDEGIKSGYSTNDGTT
jgi:hypothetical protein